MKRLAALLIIYGCIAMQSPLSAQPAFLRFLPFGQSEGQSEIAALARKNTPSIKAEEIEKIKVARFDLNGDGVDELILSLEISGNYCGTAGCDGYILQKTEGVWRKIGDELSYGMWVSDESVQGYRTIYSQRGLVLTWGGTAYRSSCTTSVPAEIRLKDYTPVCEDG